LTAASIGLGILKQLDRRRLRATVGECHTAVTTRI
jgi:hypothetical protein